MLTKSQSSRPFIETTQKILMGTTAPLMCLLVLIPRRELTRSSSQRPRRLADLRSPIYRTSNLSTLSARYKRYISTEGKRQDAATCYLRPRLNSDRYSNLHVLVESQVVRVLIDDDTQRAVGIELRTNPGYNPDAAGESLRVVKARQLVVASGGACGTPPLLERSGLGDSKVLERSGIPVIVDLPGVGNGYEDHHMVCEISFLIPLSTRANPC